MNMRMLSDPAYRNINNALHAAYDITEKANMERAAGILHASSP